MNLVEIYEFRTKVYSLANFVYYFRLNLCSNFIFCFIISNIDETLLLCYLFILLILVRESNNRLNIKDKKCANIFFCRFLVTFGKRVSI